MDISHGWLEPIQFKSGCLNVCLLAVKLFQTVSGLATALPRYQPVNSSGVASGAVASCLMDVEHW
jgi:hypothetical protein